MNWEDFMQLGVLLAAGFLAIRKADFKLNFTYLFIVLLAIAAIWAVLTYF